MRGLEGNGGFGGALRTNRPGFCAHATAGSGHTLDFALFATLWIVLELLVVEEELLPGGKDEVITAIRTFQYLVDEVHYASPRACLGIFQYSFDQAPDWLRLTNQLPRLAIRQLSSHSPEPGMRGEMVPNLFTNS